MNINSIHKLAIMTDSPVKGRGKNVSIRCPMAFVSHKSGRDRDPSLSVKVGVQGEKSVANCFSCGVRGTLLKVFQHAEDTIGGYLAVVEFIEKADAGGLIADLEGLRIRAQQVGPSEYGNWTKYAAACYGQIPQYLIDRGTVLTDVQKWRIGFDTELQRVVLPVIDERGCVVGATRRGISPDQVPKYYDTPGLPKREVFFGEHLIDQTRGRVHIVEGPLDAVFAARTLSNVVALMGAHTGVGSVRLGKLLRWCQSVVLIPDGDEAGREAAQLLCTLLRPHMSVIVAHLPDDSDPASVTPAELLFSVENASYF